MGRSRAVETMESPISTFGIKLLQGLCNSSDINDNVTFSPLSLWFALAMAALGASGGTWSGMSSVLSVNSTLNAKDTKELESAACSRMKECQSLKHDQLQVSIANGIALKSSNEPSATFLKAVKESFHGELFLSQDVIDLDKVNDWVAKQTNGQIPRLIEAATDVEMIILNAIYFKGKWEQPFKATRTKNKVFHPPSPAEPYKCRMMQQESHFAYTETNDFQAIRLPYATNVPNSSISAIVVLPKEHTTISTLISSHDALKDSLAELLDDDAKKRLVDLSLPKFEIDVKTSGLKTQLSQMGMSSAFSSDADFSSMLASNDRGLFISDIIHKVYIKVDEKGTEAAAATAVMMMRSMAPAPKVPKPILFNVDRPFAFFITNDISKDIWFTSRIQSVTKA
ncbi:Serpin domain-containing protein [Chytridium lagenaria]|nr:Serpin domain-containing protein [Chytridium lagenaria]